MSIQLRKKKLADGRVSLYLDIYHNGTRKYEFLKMYCGKDTKTNKETLQLAEKVRAQRQLDLDSSDHGFASVHRRRASFLDYVSELSKTKSDKTRRSWGHTLSHLRKYAGDAVSFSQINTAWLEGLKAYLLTNLAQNTAFLHYANVKTALRQAVRDEIIIANPCDKVKGIKQGESHRTYLTREELEKLASTSCGHDGVRRAFLFACYTGLRISDVKALTWGDIRNGRIEFTQEKTGGVEYMDLAPTAAMILGASGRSDERVFELPTESRVGYFLRCWAKAAELEKHVTFHVARHTFATLLLTYGADLYTVSKLLRHKKIQVTQVYGKIVDAKKREAVNLLPTLPGIGGMSA